MGIVFGPIRVHTMVVIVLNAVMLSVVMLSVIISFAMLNVIELSGMAPFRKRGLDCISWPL
jgi:hypothetical protein